MNGRLLNVGIICDWLVRENILWFIE